MLAFISVTPIDVIVQTSFASSSGIKLFIVIIVCVVFLVVSFFLYFQRVYQHRVSMNDIPSKSVYVPHESDLPKPVFKHIQNKLKQCQAIRIEAGPLTNKRVTINHPGLSPPIYVQERNTGSEGNLLPPNLLYQDVVHSVGDRMNFDDGFNSDFPFPKHYSFRDVVITLRQILLEEKLVNARDLPDLARMIQLYEQFKFGPDLIREREMVDFMVEFTKFSGIVLDKVGSIFSTRRKKYTRRPQNLSRTASSNPSNSRSDFHYYYSDESDDDDHLNIRRPSYRLSTTNQESARRQSTSHSTSSIDPQAYYPPEPQGNYSSSYLQTPSASVPSVSSLQAPGSYPGLKIGSSDSFGSVVRKKDSCSSQGSVLVKRHSTSSGSVVRSKLSLGEDARRPSVQFDSSSRPRQSQNSINDSRRYSGNSSYSKLSRDKTDSGDSGNELSDEEFYNFRSRMPHDVETPTKAEHDSSSTIRHLNFLPVSSERGRLDLPTRVRDLEIKRLTSPRKRNFLRKPETP